MNINRAIRLQQAADDVGTIADVADELAKLLDKFFSEHDQDLQARLQLAWPGHSEMGKKVTDPLYRLARDLTPPDA